MPNFRKLNKGGAGYGSLTADDLAFLKPDSGSNPYVASSSKVNYSAHYDDDAGTKNYAGSGIDGADDLAEFLAPSWTGDADYPHTNLAPLTDDDTGMGSGNKLTGGGGALPKLYGVGSGELMGGKAPKNIPTRQVHSNPDSRGGGIKGGLRGRR